MTKRLFKFAQGVLNRLRDGGLAQLSRDDLPSAKLREIHGEIATLKKQIATAARNGAIAAALVTSLHEAHMNEAAEWRRLLLAEQQQMDVLLSKIEAAHPAPPPEPPTPTPKPPKRHFPRLGNLPGSWSPGPLN